jgi:ADP-ribose pyrophosphatase
MDSGAQKQDLVWEVIESREDRKYGLFSVVVNRSRSPRTGNIHEFQVLRSPDWVAVVPVTADSRVVMVRQYRHGTGDLSLEPPGGLIKEGQTPEQSAREELEEETGFLAAGLELVGWMHPMPAILTNKFYVFVARDASRTGTRHPDETEEIETVLVPLHQIREYIRSGRITCSVMIAALLLFLDYEENRRS